MPDQEKDKLKTGKQGQSASNLNPRLSSRRMRSTPSVQELIDGILSGDRVLLSRAITLVESHSERHRALAEKIVEACLPHSGESIRVGITGSPGVGKSTFIEALGQEIINRGRRPAVLAIDPSSRISKGSIMGDKTRMEHLSQRAEAFIRPSPAGESLGGVSQRTRETIILCEAAGFDTILVETVGVGQSETAVHSMVDFFLLLLLPGAGDELQGIKRGIVEMADLLVINKAEGERLSLAKQARREYRNALHLFPPKDSGWTPEVMICSALQRKGISDIWKKVSAFRSLTEEKGYFEQHRRQQARYWLHEHVGSRLRAMFYAHPAVAQRWENLEKAVLQHRISPFKAADELIQLFTGINS